MAVFVKMAGKTEGIEAFLCVTRLESSVNLEEFLEAMGQNLVMRKVSLALKPVCSLSRKLDPDGTELYSQTMETVFRSVSNSFRLGEHFSENLVDRREVDSVWNYDPDSVCLKTVHIDNQGTRSSLIIIFFKFRVQGLQ